MAEQATAKLIDRKALLALALYGLIAVVFFGHALLDSFSRMHLGRSTDASFLMWALVWWPHAVRSGLNPFLCKVVWVPQGFNLAWSNAIPLAALAAAPLTATAGPVVTYNILCLFAITLAAWTAFLTCRRLCRNFSAALTGGYVFGFSSCMLDRLGAGHLNLLLIFPLPLIVLVTLALIEDRISYRAGALLLALLLVTQFLFTTEIAATAMIFGLVTIGLAWRFGDSDQRRVIRRLAPSIGVAGAASALLLAPYLYYMLSVGAPHGPVTSPGAGSINLLNLVAPTSAIALSRLVPGTALVPSGSHRLGDLDAYFGLPLLLVLGLYFWPHRREIAARLMLTALVIILILALGPRLRIGAWTGFGLPWKLFLYLPIIKNAMPSRLTIYAFLIAAMVVALWLADQRFSLLIRVSLALLIVAATLPNPDPQVWSRPVELPDFFASGIYRQYLHPDEIVLALPYSSIGDTMLWQAATGMYFRMAVGYTGLHPRDFDQWPIIDAFANTTLIPEASLQLKAFMAAHDVTAIIANDSQIAQWGPLLATIDRSPQHTGGITLYRIAPSDLAEYGHVTAAEMARRDEAARFTALLAAARTYLITGHPLAALSPMEAQRLGLLPPGSVDDPDVRTNAGLYLGPWSNQQIGVGVVGSYATLQPLIEQYRGRAKAVLFPFPKELNGTPRGDTFMRLLVMVFDRTTLIGLTPRDLADRAASVPAKHPW